MFTLAQSYNSGHRRRMAYRLGELRHEEFSHCCVHGSVGREKFRRTLLYNFFQDYHFKFFGERRRTNRECKRNSEKMFKKVISCFSSVLFLVLSVPDGTLGLKWYRARRAIMAATKQRFLRLLYFQSAPIFLILLTKEMKKGNYINFLTYFKWVDADEEFSTCIWISLIEVWDVINRGWMWAV